MKKPKVAFIHPGIGESLGGSQIFVLELAQRLQNRCDITILSATKVNELCKPVKCISRGKASSTDKYNFIKNKLKKFVSTPEIVLEHITSFIPVLFELLRNDYDVIYPNNDWGGLMVANLARKIKGTPILFTEHSGFMDNGKIAVRNLTFKPDKYITLSNDLKFWVKKYYPDINVEYIPNGVNFDHFSPEVKAKSLNLQKPIYMTAARYQKNKRLELVIEAVAKLKMGSLVLMSSGKDIETLERKGKQLLGENRFKLLSVPYSEMAAYYNGCDVFTLPSMYEPFGLVYLEAMACNKPVVAPHDLSRMDIVNNAGILCDVTDVEHYAESLEKAANTDFRNLPLEQAKTYSWANTADKYFKAIKSLI